MVSMSTWKQCQAISGLGFAMFVTCHFISHYSTLLGLDNGNAMMKRLRLIYQNPFIEPFIAISLMLHMASNTMIYMKRSALEKNGNSKKHDDATTKSPAGALELTAHRYAGYILAMAVFGHIYATRGAALIGLNDPSKYDYVMVTMATDMFGIGFTIYLIVFGMSAVWHTIYGVRSAIATLNGGSVLNTPFPIPLKVVAMMNHILIIASVLIIGGYIYPVDRTDTDKIETFRSANKAFGM